MQNFFPFNISKAFWFSSINCNKPFQIFSHEVKSTWANKSCFWFVSVLMCEFTYQHKSYRTFSEKMCLRNNMNMQNVVFEAWFVRDTTKTLFRKLHACLWSGIALHLIRIAKNSETILPSETNCEFVKFTYVHTI